MEKKTHITENEGAAGTKIGTDDAAMAHGGVVRGARPATALSRICGCGGGGQLRCEVGDCAKQKIWSWRRWTGCEAGDHVEEKTQP
jgi:hypothetical protein